MTRLNKREYSNTINDYYIRNNQAVISCNVREYTDVIDAYSTTERAWPKRAFTQYVDDNAANIPDQYPIVLELCGGSFTQKQKETIEKSLSSYYEMRHGDSQQNSDRSHRKAILLFVASVISAIMLLGFWMLGGHINLLEETLLVAFWFFLWECGDVVAFERGNVKRSRQAAMQLASISIVFNEAAEEENEDEQTGKIINLQDARRRMAKAL